MQRRRRLRKNLRSSALTLCNTVAPSRFVPWTPREAAYPLSKFAPYLGTTRVAEKHKLLPLAAPWFCEAHYLHRNKRKVLHLFVAYWGRSASFLKQCASCKRTGSTAEGRRWWCESHHPPIVRAEAPPVGPAGDAAAA